jgi:hypothetical protein
MKEPEICNEVFGASPSAASTPRGVVVSGLPPEVPR